jgi:hypothetical protein
VGHINGCHQIAQLKFCNPYVYVHCVCVCVCVQVIHYLKPSFPGFQAYRLWRRQILRIEEGRLQKSELKHAMETKSQVHCVILKWSDQGQQTLRWLINVWSGILSNDYLRAWQNPTPHFFIFFPKYQVGSSALQARIHIHYKSGQRFYNFWNPLSSQTRMKLWTSGYDM